MPARAQGHVDVIELLLQNGANVNKAKKDGATPLFAAAQQYAPNADPGFARPSGRSPAAALCQEPVQG